MRVVIKLLAVLAGLALLGATAHVTVLATGGYGDPHAVLVLAIAGGVGVGGLAVGAAWGEGRAMLAIIIVTMIAAGEAFGLLQTGERLIASREAKQAPAREAVRARQEAADRVQTAEEALAGLPETSSRLAVAIEAKRAVDATVAARASERGCAAHCRALLEQQVSAAEAEVVAARQEIADRRQAAERTLSEARAIYASAPKLPSATGLADRVGVPPWALDLVMAGLGSLAANGLGCALLAFGAHGGRRRPETIGTYEVSLPVQRPVGEVKAFCVDCMHPGTGQSFGLPEAYRFYRAWCAAQGRAPLEPGDFADGLAELVKRLGVPVRLTDKGVEIIDAVIVPPKLLPAPLDRAA